MMMYNLHIFKVLGILCLQKVSSWKSSKSTEITKTQKIRQPENYEEQLFFSWFFPRQTEIVFNSFITLSHSLFTVTCPSQLNKLSV